MAYVSLHENVNTTIEAKRELYSKLTLQAYLRRLKDPLGYRIRCMRPASTEKALEFVQEELNTLYLQHRNERYKRTEVEELRRQLLIQEARSSNVERARPPLAHEVKNGAPTPAPRRTVAAKMYSGPKKGATPAARPAASASVPAKPGPSGTQKDTGAPKPAPSGAKSTGQRMTQKTAPAPSQPAKAGPGRSRTKKKGGVNAAKPAPTPQPRPLPPAPVNMNEAWTTVVRRGPKKEMAVGNRDNAPKCLRLLDTALLLLEAASATWPLNVGTTFLHLSGTRKR
ncbi:mucin-1-like [Bombyx mandarina]|uniref:Mucin-1-like n=1 Tax=Bombyx mandarina TaxID=7092 RepID=A0A6J2KGY5_BOMMA|nr:mucin-1-like [Bombyx mandarina]